MTALSTPAEILREAARLMRERAERTGKLCPAPWYAEPDEVVDESRVVASETGPGPHFGESGQDDEVTVHIASWHPTVALAVADLLDAEATWAQDRPPTPEGFGYPEDSKCLRIARAYLGGAS
jgi:hypothetical protein